MKVLIAEDDLTNRILLQEFLNGYGIVHTAVNGRSVAPARQKLRHGGLMNDWN